MVDLADLEIVVDPGSPTPSDKLGWQKLFEIFYDICCKFQQKSQITLFNHDSFVLLVSIINDLGLYVPKYDFSMKKLSHFL